MAAPHEDASPRATHATAADVLVPASALLRRRLGIALVAVTVLAVLLSAADAPAALRAPWVLIAATLLPGFPLVVRLPVDLPTLLALDVCVSLATEAALALLLVETELWFPMRMGLVLAVAGVSATLLAVTSLQDQGPR